ncbi:MAG: hypothetical protein RLZZ244_239 [Verrucomicrobiota bacterium]|jgi:hypothetical protein
MVEIDRRKAQLIAEIEVSRGEIHSAVHNIRTSANLFERARRHIAQHWGSWLMGAASGGFVLSWLFRRRPRSTAAEAGEPVPPATASAAKTGLLISLVKIGFDLAKPSILQWATSKLSQRLVPTEENHPN